MKIRKKLIESIKEEKKNITTSLTTHEMAELLDVTTSTIIAWTKKGRIKCSRTLGGHRRYPLSEYTRIIAEMKNQKGYTLNELILVIGLLLVLIFSIVFFTRAINMTIDMINKEGIKSFIEQIWYGNKINTKIENYK